MVFSSICRLCLGNAETVTSDKTSIKLTKLHRQVEEIFKFKVI